jgi:hypothetical protein
MTEGNLALYSTPNLAEIHTWRRFLTQRRKGAKKALEARQRFAALRLCVRNISSASRISNFIALLMSLLYYVPTNLWNLVTASSNNATSRGVVTFLFVKDRNPN